MAAEAFQAHIDFQSMQQRQEDTASSWQTQLSFGLKTVEQALTSLKPVNLISLLVNFFSQPSFSKAVNTCICFLELYNTFWCTPAEFLAKIANALATGLAACYQAFTWFKDFIKGFLPSPQLQLENQAKLPDFFFGDLEFSGESLSKAAIAIISLATPILAIAVPGIVSLATSKKLEVLKTVSQLGNAVKGSDAIITGFDKLSTFVKGFVGKILGIVQPQTIKDKVLIELNRLNILVNSKNDQLALDPTTALSQPTFIAEVEEHLQQCDELFKIISERDEHYNNAYTIIQQLRVNVLTLKSNYLNLMGNMKGKMVPVTIWIYGESGIGKSELAQYITQILSKAHGKTLTTYSRNATDPFFSGYLGQDICYYDDFGASKESIDHQELVSIYTPSPFLPRLPEADKKGKVRFTSGYVIISTNHATIPASKVLTDPSILDRRRDIVIHATAPGIKGYKDKGQMPPSSFFKKDCSHLHLQVMNPIAVNQQLIKNDDIDSVQSAEQLALKMKAIYDARYQKFTEATEERIKCFRQGIVTQALPSIPAPDSIKITSGVKPMSAEPDPLERLVANLKDDFTPMWMNEYYTNAQRIRGQHVDQHFDKALSKEVEDWLLENQTSVKRPLNVLFLGKPGTGKTQLLNTMQNVEKFDEIPTLSDVLFKNLVDAVFGNDATCDRQIFMTANPTLLEKRFLQCYTLEHYLAFRRRCIIIDFSFRSKFMKTFQPKHLQKTNSRGELKYAYDSVVKLSVSKYAGNSESYTLFEVKQLLMQMQTANVEQIVNPNTGLELMPDFVAQHIYNLPLDFDKSLPYNISQLAKVQVKQGSTAPILEILPKLLKLKYPEMVRSHEAALVFAKNSNIAYKGDTFAVVLNGKTYGFYSKKGTLQIVLAQDFDTTDLETLPNSPAVLEFLTQSISLPYLDLIVFVLKTAMALGSVILANLPSENLQNEGMYRVQTPDPDDFDSAQRLIPKSALERKQTRVDSGGLPNKPRSAFASLYSETTRRPEYTFDFESSEVQAALMKKRPNEVLAAESSEVQAALMKKSVQPTFQNEASMDPGALTVADKINDQVVLVVSGSGSKLCHAIGLKGHLYVTNFHVSVTTFFVQIKNEVYPTRVLHGDELRDTLFFLVPKQVPAVCDITNHLPSRQDTIRDLTGSFALLNVRRDNQTISQRVVQLDAISNRFVANVKRFGLGYRGTLRSYGYDPICTVRGDCGSPLIIMNPSVQTKFLGFHSAAHETYGMAALLYKEDLQGLQFESQSLTVLKHQAITLQDPQPIGQHMQIIGTLGTPEKPISMYYPAKTKIFKSPFAGLSFADPTEPAVLSVKDERCTPGADPLVDALTKWDCEQIEPDQTLMQETFEELAEYFAVKVLQSGYAMKVLTKTESINGVSNIPGSNPIYRNSSPGYPFKTWKGASTKQVFFEQNDKQLQVLAKNDFGRRLNQAIDDLVNAARRKEITAVCFFGCLKDETRKLKKIYDATTTRSLIASPIDYTLAHRQYFHTASAALTSLHNETPVKIGINPGSLEWDLMYNLHAKISDVGFDVDYAGWDYRVTKHVLKHIPRIYNRIYQLCDPEWTPEHDTIRTFLHANMLEPLIIIDKYVVKCPGGQPTGQPQTALDNSLANFALFLYCWKKMVIGIPGLTADLGCMMQHVALSFYGDDNITTVKPEILKVFNFVTLAQELTKLGCQITSNAKDGSEEPFKPLDQLEFLKRHFIQIGKFKFGQLDACSLNKTLDWTHCQSSHFFDKDRETVKYPPDIGQEVPNILLEAVLHGPELYQQILTHLQKQCAKYRIKAEFMPYATAKQRLLNNVR